MLLTEALDRFEVQLQADGRSEHTRKQYRRHVLALARWAVGERLSADVEDLDHEHLASFLASPVANTRPNGARKRASSINALRTSLRVFATFCHEAGYTPTNPARLIKRAITTPPPPRALTAKEEERFLAALATAKGPEEERDAVLFRLLLGTGLRLSSALGLDIEDVDLEESALAVRCKRDTTQRVFLSGSVREELRTFIGDRESGPLFISQAGRGISARHVQRRFRLWRERAGLPDSVSPHALRHRYATNLLSRTRDLSLVQRALGHRSISSTLVYARCDDSRLRAVAGL